MLAATRFCHLDIVWVEEGYPTAAAIQLLNGKALYSQIWFDKPPLFPAVYLLWGGLTGLPLRLAGAVFVMACAWMIYRFAGKRKVFFDGRSDYYGAQFMKDYLMLPDAKPGWEPYWKQWNFTHALIPKENSLAEVLPMKGWREMGRDESAILYEKGTN